MKRDRGFTFIELLIAVTIFSVIAVSVYSVFSTGVRLWSRANPLIEANRSVRFFFNTISADLKNSVAYHSDKGVNFTGEAHRISFITLIESPGTPAAPRTELARVTYRYDGPRRAVIRSVATAREGLNEDFSKPADILDGIDDTGLGFEYCYKRPSSPAAEYEWRNSWADEDRDKGRVPRGIKVSIPGYRKTIFIPTGALGGADAA